MTFIERILVRLFYGPHGPHGPHHLRYQSLQQPSSSQSSSNKLQNEFLFSITSVQRLSIITLSLPMFGFLFCIIWSITFNFIDATSTHCGVSNYLPSVSASIGSFSPQKYFWRSTIALHTTPRYLVSFIYFKSQLHQSKMLLVINWIEITALLGLTVVSSTEIFLFHAYCFLTFILTSFLGMLIHLLQDSLWSKMKIKLFSINTMSWIMALFFYVRHNNSCETGVYTLFAASEYIFVLTNMLFHFQAYYDLKEIYLCCSRTPTTMNIENKLYV